jgi:hypothetical protein
MLSISGSSNNRPKDGEQAGKAKEQSKLWPGGQRCSIALAEYAPHSSDGILIPMRAIIRYYYSTLYPVQPVSTARATELLHCLPRLGELVEETWLSCICPYQTTPSCAPTRGFLGGRRVRLAENIGRMQVSVVGGIRRGPSSSMTMISILRR